MTRAFYLELAEQQDSAGLAAQPAAEHSTQNVARQPLLAGIENDKSFLQRGQQCFG